MQKWLTDSWYHAGALRWVLAPLSGLYRLLTGIRRSLYKRMLLPVHRLPVPVIVVGNLTVGGTGKTPLVISLVRILQQQGWHPGVISRGYGGDSDVYPLLVTSETTALAAGDEPVLIKHATDCPVVVAPDRVAAGRALLASADCDVIIADDGLQHYRLARDIEIVVIDGYRRFGNAYCLPAGPLREPLSRLENVDFQVLHNAHEPDYFTMNTSIESAVNLQTSQTVPLTEFDEQTVHAVAGIGHPQRFFDALIDAGLTVIPHAFADHHRYTSNDLAFNDDAPVLMTEKDAVKCRQFRQSNYWAVPLTADVDTELLNAVTDKLGFTHG